MTTARALVVSLGVLATGLCAPHATAVDDLPTEDAAPLELHIEELSPTVVTADRAVRISGTITNTSDETWSEINVAPFHSAFPITDSGTLSAAADLPDDAYVGDRLTTVEALHKVAALEPGETASFTTRIPRGFLGRTPGVYWVGVHASGITPTQPRDSITDGRARTFLPVAPADAAPVQSAVVLPLRAPVRHAPDGRIDQTDGWATLLGPGGRLEGLLDVAAATSGSPVTWVVDPAVPHAVSRLAAGNPAWSLDALPTETADPPETQDPTATATPTGPPVLPSPQPSRPADPDDEVAALAEVARDWLDRFRSLMAEAEVLALPYGDVDAAAMAEVAPASLAAAHQRSTQVLQALGVAATPVVASPDGHLSPAAVEGAPDETLVLLGEEGLTDDDGPLPTTGTLLDHDFAVVSAGVAEGGPGPEEATTPVAVRQRVVSEAVLRQVSGDRTPLVVAPPEGWDAVAGGSALFTALDTRRFRLRGLAALVRSTQERTLPARSLVTTAAQRESQVPATNVRAAERLVDDARVLESVLTNPAGVDTQVRDVAWTELSHHTRRRPGSAAARMEESSLWVGEQLSSITISGPALATLSGDSGTIGTTVSNGLEVPVTVNVEVDASDDLRVDVPNPVSIPPDSRRRLLLDTTAAREGVQSLTLRVTDLEGTALGAEATVQLRASEVGRLLWLIMGAGGVLLFGAIALRLFRRGLRARGTTQEGEA